MATLEEFLSFHKTHYLPAYSELVGFVCDKPAQILIEIENISAHLINYINPNHNNRQENLDKAYNHLVRLTIDCYKLLWIAIAKQIGEMERAPDMLDCLTVPREQFVGAKIAFKRGSTAARKLEMAYIGSEPLRCLEAYSKVIYFGYAIVKLFDESRLPAELGEMPPDDYLSPHAPEHLSFEEELERFAADVAKCEESGDTATP